VNNKHLEFKIGMLVSFIIIVAAVYHLYVDDELNPEAKKWIEYYSTPTDLEENAFIGLIALSPANRISFNEAKKLYKTKLSEITKATLDVDLKLKYPNVSGLPDVYDAPYFCEFNKDNCLSETAGNRAELEKVINKFSGVTNQYRALSKLTNFAPLNSIVTEPDLDQLTSIHRLAILEVYFHILDNNLNLAATQLNQLILIDRSFLRAASHIIFQVNPIVNFELYYQPLFIELSNASFSNWDIFGDNLEPLNFDEILMNRMWLMKFAQDTRVLQLHCKYIADKAEDLGHFFHSFQAQLKYKENVTLNSMFNYQKLQLIPDDAKKENLISLVKIAN